MAVPNDPINDLARLTLLRKVDDALVRVAAEYDSFATHAAARLSTPMALITLVDSEVQTFRGEYGLPNSLATIRRMPISYSICKFVVERDHPLIIHDLESDPLTAAHPSVIELGLRSYLGMPLTMPGGLTIGALSFVDYVVRHWTPKELAIAAALADEAIRTIEASVRACDSGSTFP